MRVNRMRTLLTVALFVSIAINSHLGRSESLPSNASHLTAPEKVDSESAERKWSALMSSFRVSQTLPDDQARSFVMAAIDASGGDAEVCSDGMFELSGSDEPVLIAAVDFSGRKFCNELEVISQGKDAIMIQRLDVWQVDDVNEIVLDLRHDGKHELVVPTGYSAYDGSGCVATWRRIYEMQSGSLADKSHEFPNVYRARLDALNAGEQASDESDQICAEMESDKIKRFLGDSPTAGEGKAKEWAESEDRSSRMKGIAVLADIGDPQSLAELRKLAADPDASVARAAKGALSGEPK
jgi:hypothetical protein